MPFPLQRTLDPLTEPIDLDTIKNYLRVDIPDDDDLISNLISTARERAEDLTGRSLLRQSWTFAIDHFPSYWRGGDYNSSLGVFNYRHHLRPSMFVTDTISIILPRGPVLSVDSITWKDATGTVNLLDPRQYEVDLLSEPTRIRPAYKQSWPYAMWDMNSVVIKFTTGYEQTVTEVLTVPAAAPFTVAISRQSTFLSLTSVVDVVSGLPLVASINTFTGEVTVPSTEAGLNVIVTYQVNSIPKSFIHAMKLMVGAWYDNRSEIVQGGGNFNQLPTPISAVSLLGMYELFPLGFPKG